jgi:Ca2+-binding EF-hand superfamily protein
LNERDGQILNNQIRTYDGFLFGNGLSLNFISQLQPKIPTDKQYLLQIDDFLIAFLNGQLSPREENRIFKLFYKNKDTANLDNFNKLKEAFTQFYKAHDADIEFWFGFDLLKQVNTLDYDFPTMKSFFPFMYRIFNLFKP